MIEIKTARTPGPELQAVVDMFREYSIELNENIDFQDFGKELKNPLIKYGPPKGVLLIALYKGNPAGCVAIHCLGNREECEMKRLYVRPAYRSHAVGKILCDAIILEAKKMNYKSMVLDTLKKLEPAISLYKSLGFRETDPYYSNPLPDVIYMRKELI
jgi:ribosomal protein S18 acetylase RimI-like enzyme